MTIKNKCCWSPQQDAALRAVTYWLRSRDQVFRLFGYAGTGKTELARHLAEGVDGDVLFAAFTGKAAHVMRERGCADASTIHNLIYRLVDSQEDGPPQFQLNPDSCARSASLIVIDECSMVNAAIAHDLLSFGTKVLVIGDPFQLPPPNGGGYFTEAEPDAMLTEVHRQARGNPIIQMATIVRDGGRLAAGDYGNSRVIPWGAFDAGERDRVRLTADQILVGRNVTRRANNTVMRALRGFRGALPVAGDKLVCLRNNHRKGLLNGSLWTVRQASEGARDEPISLTVDPEDGGAAVSVETHPFFFNGREHELQRWDFDEFDFGYALTVHKAQGSQWRSVVLVDEQMAFRENNRRWLYTGITRAVDQITVAQ
jgi:exodeoxyribonuclease-5